MERSETHYVMFEGPKALFCAPEHKAEMVSYPFPTPSAAIGMLEAIHWKPDFRFVIEKIYVCHKPEYCMESKRGVKTKISTKKLKGLMKRTGKTNLNTNDPRIYPITAKNHIGETITAKTYSARMLKNVRYVIQFHIVETGNCCEKQKKKGINILKKHMEIFIHRASNGQAFKIPSLGKQVCLVKNWKYIGTEMDYSLMDEEMLFDGDRYYGPVYYGLDFAGGGKPVNNDTENPEWSCTGTPRFYWPHMIDGEIDVESYRKEMEDVYIQAFQAL